MYFYWYPSEIDLPRGQSLSLVIQEQGLAGYIFAFPSFIVLELRPLLYKKTVKKTDHLLTSLVATPVWYPGAAISGLLCFFFVYYP